MKLSRKHIVIGISTVVSTVVVASVLALAFPRLFNKYAGLTTTLEVQMDDATRNLLQQRLATALASIAASQRANEDVDMQLYLVVAEHEHYLGNLIASREAYEQYLTLNPISSVAHNAYGHILETMTDYDAALVAYQKAIELESGTEAYHRDYAELLKTQFSERTQEYKAAIDAAYENVGQTTWTMIALGNWYFDRGECELGRDHYKVAISLSPDNETIQLDLSEKYSECQ